MKLLEKNGKKYKVVDYDTHWVDINNLNVGLVVRLRVQWSDGTLDDLHYHPGKVTGIVGGAAGLLKGVIGFLSKNPLKASHALGDIHLSYEQLNNYLNDSARFPSEGYYALDGSFQIPGQVHGIDLKTLA